jgi:hypothetical protein
MAPRALPRLSPAWEGSLVGACPLVAVSDLLRLLGPHNGAAFT